MPQGFRESPAERVSWEMQAEVELDRGFEERNENSHERSEFHVNAVNFT